MANTPQLIQLTIVALLAGMMIPLLVQLFLTARTLQRTSASVDRKVEDARREVHDLLTGIRRDSGASDLASVVASAAVPALIAGIRAFRTSTRSPVEAEPINNHQQETSS